MTGLERLAAFEAKWPLAARLEAGRKAFNNQAVQPGMERMHYSLREHFAKAYAELAR